MKKIITGWISQVKIDDHRQLIILDEKLKKDEDVKVTLTYDDGKKLTRVLHEWLWQHGQLKTWIICPELMTEESAKIRFGNDTLIKKLRSFEVEIEDKENTSEDCTYS